MKKMLFLLLLLSFNVAQAQISNGGVPISFSANLSDELPMIAMPRVDEAALLAEDADEQAQTQKAPLRFGKDFAVNLNLNNSGVWETLPNGDRVWRLKIHSEDARSLNFIFSAFFMPQGAQFFIYNTAKNYQIGAFTAQNNQPHGKFSTAPVMGETVILEYYEPQKVRNQGQLEVSSVIHAYRDMFATAQSHIQSLAEDFGSSGSCNIDVNCAQGANWTDQIRSVALILTTGNTRWCSGAMINNTAQNGTPYFLTADHCLDGDENTWIFIFNYDSPTCNGVDGNLSNSISGSTLRANNSNTDFALLELSSQPPANYGVYYAGWNKSPLAATSSVGIHHPSGDVKKISSNTDAMVTAMGGNTFWRVTEWEQGTTEGGSSGSPLFDANKRIIGQLYGGNASCTALDYDDYGKLSTSWQGSAASNRLSGWLDPQNSNVTTLNGQYYSTSPFANNLKIINIDGFTTCGTAQYPTLTLQNLGGNSISQISIDFQYAGFGAQTLQWTGNLVLFQTLTISLPAVSLPLGANILNVTVSVPNTTDEDASDNVLTKNIAVQNNNNHAEIRLKTDGWPEELSYKIVNATTNATIFQRTSAQLTGNQFANTLLTENLCLPAGCYRAEIADSYGDGLSGGFGSAAGYFELFSNNTQLGIVNGNFGSSATINFCLPTGNPPAAPPTGTSTVEQHALHLRVMPNPTRGQVRFEAEQMPERIVVADVLGRTVRIIAQPSDPNLDLTDLDKGVYFLLFEFEKARFTQKLVIE